MTSVSYNHRVDLPKELACLSCLKRLEASNNRIREILSWLYNLSLLELLDLSTKLVNFMYFVGDGIVEESLFLV